MKKILLLSFLIFGVAAVAQNNRNLEPQLSPKKILDRQYADPQKTVFPVKPNIIPAVKSPVQIPISSSVNVYTLIVEQTTCLSANADLGAIMFTSRGNPGASIGSSSGSIVNSFSTDFGNTWSMVLGTDDGKGNRYPGGVIYNPTGNTNIMDAYAVSCGPTTEGSGWIENFYASIKFDNSNNNIQYVTTITSEQEFPRFGMTATKDGKIHVLGDKYVFTTGVGITTWNPLVMNNGVFNAATKKFDWTRVKVPVAIANLDANGVYDISEYSTVWSPDGTVGYIVALGIDSMYPNTSFQPIIFKSTDFGATWTKQSFFDFTTIPVIQDSLWATLADPSVTRPFFGSEMESVVDGNGDLHLIGCITGAFSADPDSLGYFFKWEPKKLYHVYTTPSGWDAEFVTHIKTLTLAAAESGYGSGDDAIGWGHRVQTSRTDDGNKIFAVWVDGDTAIFDEIRLPNIVAWGKNITNNTYYPVTDFTTGTAIDGICNFHYVSDIALEENGNILLPVTIAQMGATPGDPVYHYYITSIGYGTSIGVKELNKESGLSLAGNYPNPCSDYTDVKFSVKNTSEVTVEVFNLTGQKVLSESFGTLTAGQHQQRLNVSSLKSGAYVYMISNGSHAISGKLIRM